MRLCEASKYAGSRGRSLEAGNHAGLRGVFKASVHAGLKKVSNHAA